MPLSGEKTLGPFTAQEAADGIPISLFGGMVGPQIVVIFAYVNGVLPVDCETCSIQEFPGSRFSVGAAGGSIVATATLTNLGNDKSYAVAGDGTIIVFSGMMAEMVRSAVTATNIDTVSCLFTVQWQGHDIDGFNGPPLTESPNPPEIIDSNYDPDTETGDNTFTFTYENALAEDPTSFAVQRTGPGGASETELVGSVLFVLGVTNYEYTDYSVTAPGPYTYQLIPYKLSTHSVGPTSGPAVNPDIAIITGLSFAEDLGSSIMLLSDPSGIYTLIEGKTHDTLYERTGVDHIEIAIPDPFGKSPFVP